MDKEDVKHIKELFKPTMFWVTETVPIDENGIVRPGILVRLPVASASTCLVLNETKALCCCCPAYSRVELDLSMQVRGNLRAPREALFNEVSSGVERLFGMDFLPAALVLAARLCNEQFTSKANYNEMSLINGLQTHCAYEAW